MKKVLFALAALVMAVCFTSCEVDTAKVTVTVVNEDGEPVSGRKVYAVDLITAISESALPSPLDPLVDEDGEEYNYRTTGANGTTTFTFTLATRSLTYYFYVPDEGSNDWELKTLKVERGGKQELHIEVNK